MNLRETLVCPICHSPLPLEGRRSDCPNGHVGYEWKDGRAVFPVFMESRETDNVLKQGLLKKIGRIPFLGKLALAVVRVDVVYKTRKSKNRIPLLAERFKNGRALNVGSGNTEFGPQFINVEIAPFPNVHIVSTGDKLPFPDGFFDLVISQAVLEHVHNPVGVVSEMMRVLKPGGEIYAEIPFIQGFHPTPNDYQRYTISGIELLFPGTRKIEKGAVNGPASGLCWILREFLAITFSFNSQTLYKIGIVLFGWLVLPLKFLDMFLEDSRFTHMIASGFFYLGRKDV